MATTNALSTPARTQKHRSKNPIAAGLPDPRPVTDYTAAYTTVGGNGRVTVTLSQPCVIRTPAWQFVAVDTGAKVSASSVTVVSNTQIQFNFTGVLNPAVAFVEVPYQDTQVQNFQGGFVRSGGQWFRVPVIN